MSKKPNNVFNWIAPIYGLFYNYQVKYYKRIIGKLLKELNVSVYKNIVDVGCGTGALSSVLDQFGFKVTGVDAALKMLQIAAKKQNKKTIRLVQASVLDMMPFGNKSFDVSISSFVSHGLKKDERKMMYVEMKRITKHQVIIFDYNDRRTILTDIVEWLEGGDYFNFIKKAQTEMKEVFKDVYIINIGLRVACYICNSES